MNLTVHDSEGVVEVRYSTHSTVQCSTGLCTGAGAAGVRRQPRAPLRRPRGPGEGAAAAARGEERGEAGLGQGAGQGQRGQSR